MASRSPAWMSQRRVRETSAGESGRALLIGSIACSKRSRNAGLFSGCWVCCPPRARNRAPRTELGVTAAAPKAKIAPTTVTNTTTTSRIGSMTLDLNPDDLADHEISNRLQRNSADE